MAEVASGWVSLLPSAKGFGAATQSAIGPQMTSVGKNAGKLLAAGMVGAIAAGKGLYELGQVFDDLSDTIVTTTGASGKALEHLEQTAYKIGRDTPSAFSDIGIAVAGLNQRLGLTGKPLRLVATQILNLSRITGTDLKTNIANMSRLFGDWSISTEKQAGTLDKLYAASQKTGIGVDTLSQLMVQFGSPLRQLGLDFDFTAAMFARFEREGVNIQTALPGLRMALKNFAQDGREPGEALAETFEQIKNAATAAKANTLAFEIFGARAGPDMAAAIREGRFELGDLVKTLQNSNGAIIKADQGTRDFAETWQIFKNKVLLLLRPIAEQFFAAFSDFAADVLPKVISALRTTGQVLKPLFTFIGENKQVFGIMAGGILAVVAAVAALNLVLAVNPFVLATVAIAGLVAGLIYAYQHSETFRTTVDALGTFLAETFTPTLQALVSTFRKDLLPATQELIALFKEYRPQIEAVAKFVLKLTASYIAMAAAIAGTVLPPLIKLAGFLGGATVEAFSKTVRAIDSAIGALKGLGLAIVTRVQDAQRFLAGIKANFDAAVSYMKTIPGKIKSALGNTKDLLFDAGIQIIQGLLNGIRAAAGAILGAMIQIARDAIGAALAILRIDSPSKVFYWIGEMTMAGLEDGIEAGGPKALAKMVDQLTTLRDKAKEHLGALRDEFTSLADSIATAFTPDLFQATSMGEFFSLGNEAFGTLRELRKAFKQLKKWGLDPQFLAQLFASGNAGLILDMADGTRGQAQSAAALFNDIGSLSNQVGKGVAKEVLGPKLDRANQELRDIKHLLSTLHKKIGNEVNGAVSDGHRRRVPA